MKRIAILATVIAITTVSVHAQTAAPNPASIAPAFDAYVKEAVKDWNTPGLAIAVVKDGKVVFAKGYGVRELGKPATVDTSTLFAIASTTKAMTAVAMGMLVDEGKVKWDDPVTKYLPSFQLYDPWVTRELTVRDLLTHRSGLGNTDYLWGVSDLPADSMMEKLRLVKPEYSIRSGFIYQNVMYIMAGQVIAAASGMPWAKFVQTRIFEPVGMRSTVPSVMLVKQGDNAASPHFRYGGDTIAVISPDIAQAVGPAGDVWSNVADMSRWMRFLLDSGRVNGKRLLEPETFAELFKPEVMVPPDEFYPSAQLTRPHWTTYGFGWFQEDYEGKMLDFHTGSVSGFVTIVGLIPDENFGVYVFANRDHVEVRHALMYKAIDMYLGNPPRDWSHDLKAIYDAQRRSGESAQKAQSAKRINGTKPSLALSKYTGTYEDPLFGRATVSERNGRLRFSLGKNAAANLDHWQYDTFRVTYDKRWYGTDQITFTIGEGIANSLSIGPYTLQRVGDVPAPN
jgi:CubicO group peptidase (beta-lactamase class C family)